MADLKAIEVLKRTAKMLGLQRASPSPSQPRDRMRGRGLQFMHYKANETYVAVAMEVDVDVKSDVIQVTRMAYTHDCGLVGNQDAVRSQTEDNLLHTLSWTLHEEVKFDRLRVNSTDWENYRMLTFPKVPTLLIDVIDRPDQSRLGARDAGATPVLAALADAAFNACGIRLRTTPVTSDKVKALLLA